MQPSSKPASQDQQFFIWNGHKIAYQQYGEGPDLVLLHGFPSSSRDWDIVGERLAQDYRILQFDFLGYGGSDKPRNVSYSAYRQSSLASDIIRTRSSRPPIIVGHDLGGIILQILLTGQFGAPDTLVRQAVFMNSSVYAALYRPTLSQRLLTTPIIGGLVARAMSEKTFQKGVQMTGGKHKDRLREETSRMWQEFAANEGKLLAPKHLVYMKERADASKDLETAMEQFGSARLAFLYGDADPVSGLHQLAHIRSRLPAAHGRQLEGLGHFPMLEDPDCVAAAIHDAVSSRDQPDSR
ncbi:MAG: alpha/beta hydrolase [Rhodobiaceae bacterium]|nr:alpha/beta hydrolase [Rhodobiaceae bacterium]